jgi:hypothetical protein
VVVLETGELLRADAGQCAAVLDYADISPLLACYLHELTMNPSLGKFTNEIIRVDVDLGPVVHAFDTTRSR